jgi:hypothetical protein
MFDASCIENYPPSLEQLHEKWMREAELDATDFPEEGSEGADVPEADHLQGQGADLEDEFRSRHQGVCRDAFSGVAQTLSRFWLRGVGNLLGGRSEVGDLPPMVVPVCNGRSARNAPAGTLPHRTVQLDPWAVRSSVHLGFSWMGGGCHLKGMCLQFTEDGQLCDTLSSRHPGRLSSHGLEITDTSRMGLLEDQGAFTLSLANVPDSVFACVFVIVASDTANATSDGFLQVRGAQVRLAPSPTEQHAWRYNQEMPSEMANTWICAIMYRGPHRSWRLEPLSMKLMLVAFREADASEAAVEAEAARAISWKLRWLLKDRRWSSASEERRLGAEPRC